MAESPFQTASTLFSAAVLSTSASGSGWGVGSADAGGSALFSSGADCSALSFVSSRPMLSSAAVCEVCEDAS